MQLNWQHYPWMNALVLGNTAGLSTAQVWEMQLLGLSHLFSPSGFHANCLFIFLYKNKRFLKHSIYAELIAWTLAFIFLFVLGSATGWPKPYVRSCIMGALAFSLKKVGWKFSDELIFAIACVLAFQVGAGGNLSWLLSCAGILGLHLAKKNWQKLIYPFLTTLPLCALSFGCIPLLSPVANLIFAPIIGISILPIGILSIILPQSTAQYLLSGGEKICEYWSWFAEYFCRWNYSIWYPAHLLIICLITAALFLISFQKKSRRILLFTILQALALCVLLKTPMGAWILDVGQGDAIYLRNKNENWLVDTGLGGSIPPITFALSKMGAGKLDNILLTHPDADHSGAIFELLLKRGTKDTRLWINPHWLIFPSALSILESAVANYTPIHFLTKKTISSSMECQISDKKFFTRTNDYSPICRWRLPSNEYVILTGDMTSEMEKYWIKNSIFPLKAKFLKVSHHGSKTSSSEDFLDSINPDQAIISVGRNRYGHPNEESLERIWSRNIKIRTTLEEGNIFLN